MSGFEVIGVVLGALPILISAVEGSLKGLATIQRWRRYEREVQSLVRDLQTEKLRLEMVCEKLLIGIVPPSRIENMIHDPALWREDDVQRKIRARLWKSSQNFEETLLAMNAAIDDMTARVQSHTVGGAGMWDLRRVAFTLRRSAYTEALAIIERGNSKLEGLTDRNMELEPERRLKSKGRLLKVFRDLSRNLYHALRSNMSTCTSCQEHRIGLRLEAPSAEISPLDRDDQIAARLDFRLVLSYDKTGANQAWEEMVVKAAPSPTSFPLPFPKPNMRPGQNSITFGLSTVIHQSASLVASVTGETVTLSTALCGEIRKAQKAISSFNQYGVISSPDRADRRFTVYPAPTCWQADDGKANASVLRSIWSVASLHDVLDSGTTFPHLSYRNRLQLAVVIASSTLQLFGTPWFPRNSLGSREVVFLMRTDSAYENAFVTTAFSSSECPASTTSVVPAASVTMADAGSTAYVFMRNINTTLLALGVVLIELWLGKTLASTRNPEEESVAAIPGVGPAYADLLTGRRMLPEVYRASSNYGSAVSRCLGVERELHRNVGLDDEALRHDVYSGVVAPLEKDLKYA